MSAAERLTCTLTRWHHECNPRIQVNAELRGAKHGDLTADPEAAMSARGGRIGDAKRSQVPSCQLACISRSLKHSRSCFAHSCCLNGGVGSRCFVGSFGAVGSTVSSSGFTCAGGHWRSARLQEVGPVDVNVQHGHPIAQEGRAMFLGGQYGV